MGEDRAANDDGGISLDEALALLDEIERLRAQLAAREARLLELDRLAHRDPLVDLPNRRSFIASLDHLIARVERYGFQAAMLFVDVDGLKVINDKFGHCAGDKALVQVARLIAASVRKADFVARLAGDEFGILLEHADELSAWKMALRVVETVDECQFCVGGACLPLSVAIGVGMIERGDSPESVLARADKEMYRIKAISGAAPAVC
ncbi:MAG TPA: GGDEF domain-containing protein [Sphingomicrobium sp.]|nr:GGDEF domain-containing protein [Sphingomicrobium sp.]